MGRMERKRWKNFGFKFSRFWSQFRGGFLGFYFKITWILPFTKSTFGTFWRSFGAVGSIRTFWNFLCHRFQNSTLMSLKEEVHGRMHGHIRLDHILQKKSFKQNNANSESHNSTSEKCQVAFAESHHTLPTNKQSWVVKNSKIDFLKQTKTQHFQTEHPTSTCCSQINWNIVIKLNHFTQGGDKKKHHHLYRRLLSGKNDSIATRLTMCDCFISCLPVPKATMPKQLNQSRQNDFPFTWIINEQISLILERLQPVLLHSSGSL